MASQIKLKRTLGIGLPDLPPVGTGVTDGELVYVYDTTNIGAGGTYRKLYIGSAAGVSTLPYPVGGQYYMERMPDDLTQEGVLLPRKVLSANGNSLIDRVQVGSGLSVSGISTFKDDVIFEGNVDITGDLSFDEFTARQFVVTGVGTFDSSVSIGVSLGVPDAYIAAGLITSLVGTYATVTHVDVTDIQVSGASSVTGIATFGNDVYVAGNLNVTGDLIYDEVSGRNINITGVGTIANFNSGLGTITTLDTETFDALNANITGLAVTDIVGTAATITTIDNNLGTIDNVATLDALNARITAGIITDIVGTAATITTLDVSAGDIVNARITAGIITDIVGTAATITTIDVDTLDALNARITAGIITDIVGTAATITTLDVNTGDIQTLFVNAGLATDLAVTNLRAQTGIITDAFINSGVITSITGTYSTITNLVGTSGTFQNLNVDVNLDVDGHTELDNVNISGISTLNNVEINGNLNIYTPDVLIQNNLLVSGNLSVGGTFTSVNVADLRVNDKDLVLGITTNLNNDDVSNDNTANHGGVAIASTEGSPLVSLKSTGINTLPDTYKQIMWVKGGTFGIGTTDAFLINYAVGIGSTNVPLDAYAAIGANHIYERSINTPNLNVAENAVVSGILTGTTFDSETAIIDNLQVAGTTTTGQLNVTGVSTFQGNVNLGDNDRLRFGDDNDLEIFHDGTNSNIQDNGTGSLLLYGNSSIELLSSGTGESLAKFFSDGAAELYYDNSKKFETTGVGVTVYGNTETQTLNVTGVSTVTGIATFQSDVYIDGNLNVKGDLTYDEVRGRNLSISGVGTIANVEIGTASTNTINTLSGALTLNSEIGFNVAISTHTNVVGYLSATDGIYYEVGDFNGPNGIAYFDSTGLLVSSASTVSAASTSNYLLTTNATGVPVWTNVFEGGSF